MAKKPDITTVTTGYYSTTALNSNFEAIRDAFENFLSRDGETPNTMEADLDLNGNDLLNVGDLTLSDGTSINDSVTTAAEAATEAAASAVTAEEAAASAVAAEEIVTARVPRWTTPFVASGVDSTVEIPGVYTNERSINLIVGGTRQRNYTLSNDGVNTTLTVDTPFPEGETVWAEASYQVTSLDAALADIMYEDGTSISEGQYVSYEDRSTLVTKVSVGSLDGLPDGAVVIAGAQAYQKSTGATDIDDLPDYVPFGKPTPQHWGFVADKSAGHTAKFQAALDYAKENSTVLFCPAGEYLLEDEIDGFYLTERLQPYGLRGEGRDVTVFYYNFDDPTKTVLNFARSDGTFNSVYQVGKFCSGFTIARADGRDDSVVGPCAIDVAGWGDSFLRDVRIENINNTAIRGSRASNLRFDDVFVFGGGYNFPTVDFSSVTVSGTSGNSYVDLSSGTLATADAVGMKLFVTGGTASRTMVLTITGAPSGTRYNVAETLDETFSGANCTLGAPLVSGSSGGSTLTSNIACFSADQVGLFAYVWLDGGGMQRVKITGFTDSKTVSITCAKDSGDPMSTAATLPDDITGQPISVAAVDLSNWIDLNTSPTGFSNDFHAQGLTLAHCAGVSLAIQGATRTRFYGVKIHGDGDAEYQKSSNATLWADNVDLLFSDLIIDSEYTDTRVKVGSIRPHGIRFTDLFCTQEKFSPFADVDTQTGNGRITIGTWLWNGAGFDQVLASGSADVVDYGTVYGPYLDAPILHRYESGSYEAKLVDNQDPANEVELGTVYYTRVGSMCTVFFGFVNNIDTTGLTGTDAFRVSLPYEAADVSCGVAIDLRSPASGTSPYWLYAVQDESFAYIKDSAGPGGDEPFSIITSGTTDIRFGTLTYRIAETA